MGKKADPLQFVYPDIRTRILRVYTDMKEQHGLEMRACQGLRSWKEQNALFAQGRTKRGPLVTWAQAGQSPHNFGLAVDSCFGGPDPWLEEMPPKTANFLWDEYGKFVEAYGFKWGGRFSGNKIDRPHAELLYGLTLAQVRELYKIDKLLSVWAKADQLRGIPIALEWQSIENQLKAIG